MDSFDLHTSSSALARPLSTACIVGNITYETLTTVPSQTPPAVAKMKRPMRSGL